MLGHRRVLNARLALTAHAAGRLASSVFGV